MSPAEQRRILHALRECASALDQVLNGQCAPDLEAVDAALMLANPIIQEHFAAPEHKPGQRALEL